MKETIAEVFDRLGKDVPVNEALLKRIHRFERGFVNRSKEHLEFFGGNLMGVNPIRFRPVDRDEWFADVIQMDELDLKDGIANVQAIKKDWKRASDAMNLSCIWLLHRINESTLSNQHKKEGMVDTLLILQYKFLASLMAHFYPYPANREIMEAAYASLSRRYALKVAGSWNKLLHVRAEEIISSSGIHRRTFQKFNDDMAIINMVSDIQSRLRKIIKTMTAVFYAELEKGSKIGTDRKVLDIDGKKVLREKSRHYSSYIRYLHQVADDPRSFIRRELVEVVCDLQRTCDPRRLMEALEWCSVNHREVIPRWHPKVEGSYVEAFFDEVLLYAFSLVSHKQALITGRSGIAPLLAQLRTLYMASRMADPSLLKAKEMADNIVNASINSRNVSVAASVRTGLQLYVILRSLTLEHYAS